MITHLTTKHSRTPNMPGTLSAKIATTGANSGLCPDYRAVTHSIRRGCSSRGAGIRGLRRLSPERDPGSTSRGIAHVRNTCTPPVKRAKLSTRQCFPNIAGAEPRQKIECCPAARRSIVADAVAADSVLASAGVRQRHLPTAPDRVTGAEPTNDDTAAGVCRRSSSGRPGVCSSCAPTANVATSIFRPRRRRR